MADPSIERFRRVIRAAAAHLDERRKEVNDLNVFPVADGDTGDNMALTLRAVSDELDRLDGQLVDEVGRTELVNALARAALMGARGNSGVILSQIVRGAAEELASRPGELVDPMLVASAFARAADAAYESVREPAEGTMLTVFREMAHSISRRLAHMDETRLSPDATPAEQDALLAELLEGAVRDGERAVARTPEQLEVGVLVVGDEATLKVHVHTDVPEAAVALFDSSGAVSQLDVGDMREQIAERRERLQAGRCAAVAVVAGRGMRELYEGLGAFVVDGGETFNPSIYDLLAAIHEVPSEEVLVFPNNPNVMMAAERAAELSDKHARVVDCTSQQAGLPALVELDPRASIDENERRLADALDGIAAGSVAPAARNDAQGRFVAGDAVGFVGD